VFPINPIVLNLGCWLFITIRTGWLTLLLDPGGVPDWLVSSVCGFCMSAVRLPAPMLTIEIKEALNYRTEFASRPCGVSAAAAHRLNL